MPGENGMSVEERRAVGHRLRVLREGKGWSRDDMAERLGVHAGSIARWETGGSVPHAYTLEKIAELAGASAEWIRSGRNGPAGEGGGGTDAEAEDPFASADHAARFVGGIAPPGQERLRKLDALEGLRRMLTARGLLPGWWYELQRKVEAGEL